MKEKAQKILKKLTLEEKAGLCSGQDFWTLKSIDRVGLSSIMVNDGPHGLRKPAGGTDHIGLSDSVKATCFPTASATASSWDVDLLNEMGQALAEECLQENTSVVLGPGANIKRSPLCGRNFEYISEDPYHTGHMAAALINGVQSKGIGTSLKHYVINNQENRRMSIDAVVDERAQREIYLTGFEIAVKNAQPWTVMCSYNKVDGTYLSDNKRLLNDILKEEWGHTGLVVTDWGATNDRVEGIRAGMELEMPSSHGKNDELIVAAVNNGTITEALLDKAVVRIIELILKSQESLLENYTYDTDKHHALARKITGSSAVLLKNEGLLPLAKDAKIAVIGEFAKTPRYQGSGSSQINPPKIDNICNLLDANDISYKYAQGYSLKSGKARQDLIDEAVKTAASADMVVVVAGLTADYESEGFDRTHLNMPESHNELIKQVAVANSNTIVVLQNGSPVTMPWIDDVNAILEGYLGGQAGAGGIVDILFGDVNPSGKLSETFPVALEDNSSYKYFPENSLTVEHRESIFVGYRYYDTAKKEVLFPFGHGLSYTEFEYSNLSVENIDGYDYKVNVNIKNTGKIAGSEIIQLYIKNNESAIFKADKELKAFCKVYLKPGEEKRIELNLDKRSFAYYNVDISNWHVDSGVYEVLIGASSRDIRLASKITLIGEGDIKAPNLRVATPDYYNLKDEIFTMDDIQFETLYGKKLPKNKREEGDPFDQNSTMGDIKHKFVGKLLHNMITKNMKQMAANEDGEEDKDAMRLLTSIVDGLPLRAFGLLVGDRMPKFFTEGIVEMVNGRFFKGLRFLSKK